jgi:hypothetical protein
MSPMIQMPWLREKIEERIVEWFVESDVGELADLCAFLARTVSLAYSRASSTTPFSSTGPVGTNYGELDAG